MVNNRQKGGREPVVQPDIVERNENKLETSIEPEPLKKPEITETSEIQKFQFTRHLQSCNNIKQGKDAWWKLQARSALISGSGKDFEPGGTVYGIKETIKYTLDSNNAGYFNFNHIYEIIYD